MKSFRASLFYICLWVLYFLQGSIYPTGHIVASISLVGALIFSIFHFFIVSTSTNSSWIKSLSVFICFITIYGIPSLLLNYSSDFLKNVYLSLLPIYSCYYYIYKGIWNEKFLKWVAIVLLLLTIVRYISTEESNKLLLGKEEITNNMGARFVGLMPCLFLFSKQRIIQISLLLVIFIFTIQGFKRGAILIGIVCFIYFILNTLKNSKSIKEKLVIFFLISSFIGYGIFYVGELYNQSTYFQRRIENTQNGDSSNRDLIYTSLTNEYLYNYDLGEFLFGRGLGSTVKICGTAAHQDWLELLIDCGLCGAFIYFCFFLKSYECIKNAKNKKFSSIFVMSIIILFLKSLFSMGFQAVEITTGIWISYGYYMMNKKIDINREFIE